MILSLTGFMGCGKSSVGKELAALLACPFHDLDDCIKEVSGKSIPEIFLSQGEAGFRKTESEVLESILRQCGKSRLSVIALGGGTPTNAGCLSAIKEKTFCIYLRAGIGTLLRNIGKSRVERPLLSGEGELRGKVEKMLEYRTPVYEDAADLIIDTDGQGVRDTALEIYGRLSLQHGSPIR